MHFHQQNEINALHRKALGIAFLSDLEYLLIGHGTLIRDVAVYLLNLFGGHLRL